MHLTYQYKLKPSRSQELLFDRWLGICRYVYNTSLDVRLTCFKNIINQPSAFDLNYQLNNAKKEESLSFLKEVHSDVLAEANERTKKTIDKVFANLKKGKWSVPKFKNKHTYNSFTFKRDVEVGTNVIKLPKIGRVRYYNSRPIPPNAKIKYSSIIKKQDGWYINIQLELTAPTKVIDENQAIGIDVGVKVFAYLSNGEAIKSNYFLEPQLKRLRVLQRKLSRCQKGSKRREKVRRQVAKLHSKIAAQRKDFNHKTSTNLANRFDIIVIEDLKISNMTKLNATLSRRMLDNGFYQFRTFLEYKSKELICVPPHYTSQQCSSCGEIDKMSRVSQEEYCCTSCGHMENADENAAKNIKAKGISFRTKRNVLA